MSPKKGKSIRLSGASPAKKIKLSKSLSISKVDIEKISQLTRASPGKKKYSNKNGDIWFSKEKETIPELKLKFKVKKQKLT